MPSSSRKSPTNRSLYPSDSRKKRNELNHQQSSTRTSCFIQQTTTASTKRKSASSDKKNVSFSSGANFSQQKTTSSNHTFRFNRSLSKPASPMKRTVSHSNDLNMVTHGTKKKESIWNASSSSSSSSRRKNYSSNGKGTGSTSSSSSSSSRRKNDSSNSKGTGSTSSSSSSSSKPSPKRVKIIPSVPTVPYISRGNTGHQKKLNMLAHGECYCQKNQTCEICNLSKKEKKSIRYEENLFLDSKLCSCKKKGSCELCGG